MSNKIEMEIVPESVLFRKLLASVYKHTPKKIENLKIIDLGCGNKPYERLIKNLFKDKAKKIEYIGIDYYNKRADLLIDLNKERIPLKDSSVDLIICTEVLEHLYDPFFLLSEIRRTLKNKGILLITNPFLYAVHEKKNDYFRFTHNFYRHYFKEDEIIKECITNTSFSFLFYLLNSYAGHIIKIPKKVISFLQKPFDFLGLSIFKKRIMTYSYYKGIGYIIKIHK